MSEHGGQEIEELPLIEEVGLPEKLPRKVVRRSRSRRGREPEAPKPQRDLPSAEAMEDMARLRLLRTKSDFFLAASWAMWVLTLTLTATAAAVTLFALSLLLTISRASS